MHINIYGPTITKLRLVSRDFSAHVLRIYHGERTLIIARSRIDSQRPGKVRIPHPKIGLHINKLELHVQIRPDLSTFVCPWETEPFSEHRCAKNRHRTIGNPSDVVNLMRPKHIVEKWEQPEIWLESERVMVASNDDKKFHDKSTSVANTGRSRLTHWQQHFSRLSKLNIKILVGGCLNARARDILIKSVAGLRTFLRAEQVQVVVQVDGCHETVARPGACDGQCTQTVQAVFKNLMDSS